MCSIQSKKSVILSLLAAAINDTEASQLVPIVVETDSSSLSLLPSIALKSNNTTARRTKLTRRVTWNVPDSESCEDNDTISVVTSTTVLKSVVANERTRERRHSFEKFANDQTIYLHYMSADESKPNSSSLAADSNQLELVFKKNLMNDKEISYEGLDGTILFVNKSKSTLLSSLSSEDSNHAGSKHLAIEGKFIVIGDVRDFAARYVAAVVARALALYLRQTLERAALAGGSLASAQVRYASKMHKKTSNFY